MPRHRPTLRTHALAYAGLALLLLVSVTHWARNSFDRIDEAWHPAQYARQPFELGDFADAFRLQPEAEALGIRNGDVVVAIDDRPVEGLRDFYAPIRRARAGDRLRLRIRRGTGPSAAGGVHRRRKR